LISAALALTPVAAADDTGGNAATCRPQSAFDVPFISFDPAGSRNFNKQGSASVVCGTLRLTSSSPRNLYVDYDDESLVDEIVCTATVYGWNDESVAWSQVKHSGVLNDEINHFHFTIASGAVGYVELQCTLPPEASGHPSAISGFNLQ
jgi:hypothetical protein